MLGVIDDTIFEGDKEKALELSYIFRGISRRIDSRHIACKCNACLGSVFRLLHQFDLAEQQIQKARKLTDPCDECSTEVHKRWAVILYYQDQFEDALHYCNKALAHGDRTGNAFQICDVLLRRAGICRALDRNSEGMKNIVQATNLLLPEMSDRYYIAAAVNAISLAAGSDDEESFNTAIALAGKLREKIKGIELNSRVLGIVRWIRGLAFEKLRDITSGARCLESAISTFDRLDMREEKTTSMADLARVRRKGKQ